MGEVGKMDLFHPNAAPFFMKGGEHAVLLTHGFTGSAGHMHPLGDILNAKGFTVQGILLPGHGTNLEDMRQRCWQEWLDAELTAVEALKKEYRYVSVAGLSMGGDLSLIAASRYPLTACVSISAPMKTKARFGWAARIAALVKPVAEWTNGAVTRTDLIPEYNIGYTGMPVARVYDLRQLMKQARRGLGKITCPLLVIQSHADETISEDSAQIILDGAGTSVKKTLWLDGVPHVCTISTALDQIAEEMADFLKSAEK
ncbi:MAG: alpha/beta fold hydrolase [Clostridia bacterium]|nr:alpha/beta fold hydrolase [Clostridia bacterium]